MAEEYKTRRCYPKCSSIPQECKNVHQPSEFRLGKCPRVLLKYKTEWCRFIRERKMCPYGPRCWYVHTAEEKRSNLEKKEDVVCPAYAAIGECYFTEQKLPCFYKHPSRIRQG